MQNTLLPGIFIISSLTTLFIGLDKVITKKGYQNPYYALHALHNGAIVALTLPDVINTFKYIATPHGLIDYTNNMNSIYLCYALHIYHILAYFYKLRFDDWLHHILMIGLALPIGTIVESRTLVGFSLFFTTGLPGGIDYSCLFAVRNGWMKRETEKRINDFLNVWIRSPGCVAQACFTLAYICGLNEHVPVYVYLPAILNYWNGQYFMKQVVRDLALVENNKLICDKK
jgi:hypothetical protein